MRVEDTLQAKLPENWELRDRMMTVVYRRDGSDQKTVVWGGLHLEPLTKAKFSHDVKSQMLASIGHVDGSLL